MRTYRTPFNGAQNQDILLWDERKKNKFRFFRVPDLFGAALETVGLRPA
jgi:hypothetical protein